MMSDHQVLLDAFADARRTWDELVSLQPDILAGENKLTDANLIELERRAEAHRAAVDLLTDALETDTHDPASSR
jgi:hypothetical protein